MTRVTRRVVAATVVSIALLAAGCSDDTTPVSSGYDVDACPEAVEGFGVDVDADGEQLPDVPSSAPGQKDPRSLTGPSTASLDGVEVEPMRRGADLELPVTVKSCDDELVEISDTSRILAVDMNGTLAEIVFSLGLGDQVVGRDTSTGFEQAADLPLVTPAGHDLNAEAILGLDPTVVLTDASIGPREVQEQLREAGIPVVFFDDARTLDGVPSQIRAVAGALGVPDVGERLIERTQDDIVGALRFAPTTDDPLRIAFLYVRGQSTQLIGGPGSGADSLVQALGAIDVGTELGLEKSFTAITSEALIEASPDVIIMMTGGLESIGGPDGAVKLPGVAQTPAGENRRFVDMEDSTLLSFGPRTGQIIQSLARAIYQTDQP